jgi:hypothetical protein
MNSMIVAAADHEYHSYMLENLDLKLLRTFSVLARVVVLPGRQCYWMSPSRP